MATAGPPTPPISPDGNYWWDGQSWQPMPVPASAPVAPPTPGPSPVDKPAWLDQAPAWLDPQAAVAPAPPVENEPAQFPAWAAPTRKARPWIYLTGALVIAVLALTGVWVRGQILTFQATSAPVQRASPSPLMSDYERADRFLNVELAPSVVEATNTLTPVETACTPSLPPACKDALIATDKAMVKTEDVLNTTRDIPVCIAREVQQFKDDWIGMEQGVALAISGFQANSRDLTVQGLQRFGAIAQYVSPDVDRITKAEATCKH